MEEQCLINQIDRFIENNAAAIEQDIAALVAIDSVRGPATPGAPYGMGPRRALDAALNIARGMGLAVNDGDGHVGWAELPGAHSVHLATITHLDTVPCGEGWDEDALVLRKQNGWLIGRGVVDDKGPSVLCLYLAKFFKELSVPLRYGLRVLLGCDEETGMADVGHYLSLNPEPFFCFSPDSSFPLVNGEKGILQGTLVSQPLNGALVAFEGGIASNAVPARACCVVRCESGVLQRSANMRITPTGNGLWQVEATGVGGHAARPEGTRNAIGMLVDTLLAAGICTGEELRFMNLLGRLHAATDGSGLGIACRDETLGALTCIGGIIRLQDGLLRQNLNIRYPQATSGSALTAALAALAEKSGARFEADAMDEPFYIPAHSAPIRAMLSAYGDVSGRPAMPFTIGGGTYARYFKNAVSCGPTEENTAFPTFAGPEHGPNEGIRLSQLLLALKVYILGVHRLQQLPLHKK